MRLVLDMGQLQDLTSAQIKTLDAKLRNRFPKLVSWSLSPLTGEFVLDLGEDDETGLETRIQSVETKAEGKRKRLELLEMVKTW